MGRKQAKSGRPSLADVLREAIRGSGKTAYAVAAESGVGHPVLSRFLSGQRGLNLDTADKLCRALGLELRRVE
jgi:plasmid maintenance system antidote protein VapI